MRYVILLEDNPTADPGIRAKLMPDHLRFLEANGDHILAAGPLKDESGAPAGGIWVIEAESVDVAGQLIREDPFWPTGLRQSWRVLEWTRVFADGARLIQPG